MTDGLHGPDHANTYPPESTDTDRIGMVDSVEKAGPEPSMRSSEPLNVSYATGGGEGDALDVEEGVRARKRGTFMDRFRGEVGEPRGSEDDDPKGVVDKQKFTAVGQFKATVLNSWINVLLLAAPVGSMLTYLFICGVLRNVC